MRRRPAVAPRSRQGTKSLTMLFTSSLLVTPPIFEPYQKCGKLEEQIELLKQKLWTINEGEAFNRKPTKTARSHGRMFQVTIQQVTSRILQGIYAAAEMVYRRAQMIDPDANKTCNLGLCLIKQAQYDEARSALEDILHGKFRGSNDPKSRNRAHEMLQELEPWQSKEALPRTSEPSCDDCFFE